MLIWKRYFYLQNLCGRFCVFFFQIYHTATNKEEEHTQALNKRLLEISFGIPPKRNEWIIYSNYTIDTYYTCIIKAHKLLHIYNSKWEVIINWNQLRKHGLKCDCWTANDDSEWDVQKFNYIYKNILMWEMFVQSKWRCVDCSCIVKRL